MKVLHAFFSHLKHLFYKILPNLDKGNGRNEADATKWKNLHLFLDINTERNIYHTNVKISHSQYTFLSQDTEG